jgi:hypothetical protein
MRVLCSLCPRRAALRSSRADMLVPLAVVVLDFRRGEFDLGTKSAQTHGFTGVVCSLKWGGHISIPTYRDTSFWPRCLRSRPTLIRHVSSIWYS